MTIRTRFDAVHLHTLPTFGAKTNLICSHIFIPKFRIQSILQYNGGAVIAMAGKNCVGICSDLRLGQQALTVAKDFEKVRFLTALYSIPHSHLY